MPVPDQVPRTHDEPSETMRRNRALNRVQRALTATVRSLEMYVAPLPYDESIKLLHHDITNLVDRDRQPLTDNDGMQRRYRYYSLWTSFADMRLLENGHLAQNDWPVDFNKTKENHGDDSRIVTLFALQNDPHYNSVKLTEIATQLEKLHTRITPEE